LALYPVRAMERAMKIQEVILRAIRKQITWIQAVEMLRIRGCPVLVKLTHPDEVMEKMGLQVGEFGRPFAAHFGR